MADLRDMQLLAALSRHKHFARAADECGISQPAFSARIRNMEADFGVPLVKRGNRYLGFTKEGEVVLKWALRLLADADGLKQEVEQVKGALAGQVTIGVVPTAIAFAGLAAANLRSKHPAIRVVVRSASSTEIQRGLDDFSFDAGITYLEGDLPRSLVARPIYEERYTLISPPHLVEDFPDTIPWADAAKLPLCLLTKDMRNRKIIDEIFAKVGADVLPVMEANVFTAALVQAQAGLAATIAPHILAEKLLISSDLRRLKLVEPLESKAIGLVTAERTPVPPALKVLEAAMLETAEQVAESVT